MPIQKIELKMLEIGDVVTLHNENADPDFGSVGPSKQQLRFLGEKDFEVIESTRSLDQGMLLTATTEVWNICDQLNFIVNAESYVAHSDQQDQRLYFKMRPIRKIEIQTDTKSTSNV